MGGSSCKENWNTTGDQVRIGILSTCEHYGWAGTEEVWFHFAKRALESRHEVILGAHIKVASSSQVQELQSLGLQVCHRTPRKPARLYLLAERIQSQMKRLETCDVVLVNAGSLYDTLNLPWIGCFVSRLSRAGKRIVYFCHFCAESLPATQHSREAVANLVSTISEWVFVSEHNRQLAQRQFATRFKKSSVVINGPRLRVEKPCQWPHGPVVFGCVARLETRWKGHDVLLDCLAQPQWQSRDWRLNLYGSGPDEKYIQDLVKHYGLEHRVYIRGYVRDMQQVWSECHIKVLASHGEGTPLAVLEAMMCGRAVITTDVGGNCEILTNGETGFIADAATPRSFGGVLEAAWQRRNAWVEMGEKAHLRAVELYGSEPAQGLLKVVVREGTSE
jgi:glycosyltransferase involved in cell wall biosynthesis